MKIAFMPVGILAEPVKLVPALLIEGALFRVVRGLVDDGTRRGFARVTGTWPGQERPEPE